MDFEERLLSRVTVNYLFLGQYETFRASVQTLWRKNSSIAIAILQAVIKELGDIKGISWSKSITSPAHLAWLAFSQIVELQKHSLSEKRGGLSWGIDSRLLKLQLEALFLLHQIIQIIQSNLWLLDAKSADALDRSSSIPSSSDHLDTPTDDPDTSGTLDGSEGAPPQEQNDSAMRQSMREGLHPLKLTYDAWFAKIKLIWASVGNGPSNAEAALGVFDEETLLLAVKDENLPHGKPLKQVVLCVPELLNALCWTIVKMQLLQHKSKKEDGLIGDTENSRRSTPNLFNSILLQKVQQTFLDILREDLSLRECLTFLPLLQTDFGIADEIYRDVLFEIMRKAVDQDHEVLMQGNVNLAVFELFQAIQASGSSRLVSAMESSQDSYIYKDGKSTKSSSEPDLPPPLQYLHQCFKHLRGEYKVSSKNDGLNADVLLCSCLRQLFHYSRVTGAHMFDIVMGAALSALKMQEFQKAIDILAVFPRLQPLAAVIGWDLLAGSTTARRLMLEALWVSRSPDSPARQGHQICCVDHLCNQLCYRLDLAYFTAHINSGLELAMDSFLYPYQGQAKSSSMSAETKPADEFVANFVLERLTMHSPIRVLFDVVPNVKLKHARTLLKMYPTSSEIADSMRLHDMELLELHFGIQGAVLTLAAMEKGMQEEKSKELQLVALKMLEDLRAHILSISNIPRRIFFMGIIVDLLLMDDASMPPIPDGLESKLRSFSEDKEEVVENEEAVEITTTHFISRLLKILWDGLFSSSGEPEDQRKELVFPKGFTSLSGQKAWEWKKSNIIRFIEDWNWRLAVLQRLAPSPQRHWQWKEALAVLRAAPSTLLNMCVQRAQYDLGEEAVHRFSLPPEDAAALQLAEWVDRAVARASVDDAVSRVAEGASSAEEALELATLHAPLAPLVNILLCIDVAAASARAMDVSRQLLLKARSLLSDLFSGSLYRQGSIQAEQIQEACMLSVSKRVVQCLQELLEKVCTEKNQTLQALLSGIDMVDVISESQKHVHRYRALNILQQTIDDAHNGKRQFLSGKLHNLVKALADDESEESLLKAVPFSDKKVTSVSDSGFLLGYGVRGGISKQSSGPMSSATGGDHSGETTFFPLKGTGKRYLGPLVSKPFAYLSAFILYIATIGDIVDGVDTTHDFNFFTLVYERSNDLLTRLVFERGNANAAGKIAEIMGADLAQEVISACVSPIYPPKSSRGWACVSLLPFRDAKPETQYDKGCSDVAEHEAGLYPLNLDVVKHLASLSPVRAILACVFGTSRFRKASRSPDSNIVGSNGNGPVDADTDRSFYEFALDQSDRFSTLNRWIQTQANLQQLSNIPVSSRKTGLDGQQDSMGSKTLLKRPREHDSDTESEEDQERHGNAASNLSKHAGIERSWKIGGMQDSSVQVKNSSKTESSGLTRSSTSLVFEWENESIYEDTVSRLVEEGKMVDALALADRYLRGGAPDNLLQLLIEDNDGGHGGPWQGNYNTWNMTWQYCIRLRDKKLAASLALKHFRNWDLEAAIDVLTMCSCHLAEKDRLHDEVLQLKQSLQLYNRILQADGRFTDWREVESLCQSDPEELALRLAGKGAVPEALEVAEHYKLRNDLRRDLQGRLLVKLLASDPIDGGGPAEALRFLCSLKLPEDALPVAMAAMGQLPSLHAKQLLVHFFLKKRVGNLSDDELLGLRKLALGLQMLGALPLPWQQRCGALHQHPQLILETLLMWKQLQAASELLNAFPALRDDVLILNYAAKAISTGSYPNYERRLPASKIPTKSIRSNVAGRGATRSNVALSQKDSRQPFLWSRDTGNKITPKDGNRKRKSTALSPAQKVAWDTISTRQEERVHTSAQENVERLTPLTMTEGWVLTGDPVKDAVIRDSHRYESAPCITLFKSLLGLCSSEEVAAKESVRICVKHMKQILTSEQLPSNASSVVVERAFYATEAFVQALLHAEGLLRKILGNSDLGGATEGLKDANHNSQAIEIVNSDAQLPNSIPDLLYLVVEWLSRAELLQSLLGSGVTASLDDVLTKDAAEKLRDRLIRGERYNMAVYCCTKCKVNAFPVWKAWAHALVQMEHYPQARVKLKQALKLHKDDPAPIVREIIATMEASPPVDIPSVRSLYDHTVKNVNSIMDDSLSAVAYLNVLSMPSSFIKYERTRRISEDSVENFATYAAQSGGEEAPGTNLDSSRYNECIFYLQEYARQDLLPFMFKHCHYADACLLFFPPRAVPSPPSMSTPQKSDSLATEYGSIDDLCELCVAYGAMPVLERIIATRELAAGAQDPAISHHTAAALARICTYCETHKHFNHLYRFQLLRKDHVAAGVCCIQLFLNSSNQEQALRQLERAKTHFDDGFYARQQGNEIAKAQNKAARGKSPSDKFSEEDLMKFSTRISTQMEVVRCFSDAEGPPWKHSLFGNPSDADTLKRRLEVVEALVERNFDLAFRIIYDFELPPVQIYAAVATSLADRKKGNQLTELFKNIKATISDDDLDQVIGAAIMVFANKHKERPDRLIDMLSSHHRKVLSCVACGRLKMAFQIASRNESIADVQYVSDQAKRMGMISVVDMCKQWLSRRK